MDGYLYVLYRAYLIDGVTAIQKKHRICTTISAKHWALLKKLEKEHDTQKNVLELALENLANNPGRGQPMAPEDELFIRLSSDSKALCTIQKNGLKRMLETIDIGEFEEFIAQDKPVEHAIEYIYQKPLKECTFKELIEGVVLLAKMTRYFDTINCKDNGDHYLLAITHNMGINNSRTFVIGAEMLFKAYGARYESKITDCSIFVKIYKDQ